MKHKKKLYQEPTLDIIKITAITLLAGSDGGQGETHDGDAREYYYTDPFHYLNDINE